MCLLQAPHSAYPVQQAQRADLPGLMGYPCSFVRPVEEPVPSAHPDRTGACQRVLYALSRYALSDVQSWGEFWHVRLDWALRARLDWGLNLFQDTQCVRQRQRWIGNVGPSCCGRVRRRPRSSRSAARGPEQQRKLACAPTMPALVTTTRSRSLPHFFAASDIRPIQTGNKNGRVVSDPAATQTLL